MTKSHLLSTVAIALLIGTAAATAQTKEQLPPERAPAAQQTAPAEKVAPPARAGQRKAPETTGQSTQGMKPGENKEPATTGQAPTPKAPESDTGGPAKSQSMDKDRTMDRGKSSQSTTEQKRPSSTTSGQSTTEQNRSPSTTTGQGAAAGTAKLSAEQRTKITTVIKKQNVKPVNVNFSIKVGTRVPASVRFYPLPTEVVTIYPEWRGYDYILVGDQILIIDPDTHEIVAILVA